MSFYYPRQFIFLSVNVMLGPNKLNCLKKGIFSLNRVSKKNHQDQAFEHLK